MQKQRRKPVILGIRGPSVPLSFDRSVDVIPEPSVGVWDQCLKFGVFQKENLNGELTTTVFNEVTCGQMLDWFRDHKNDLWMDSQHGILRGKGYALCYHNGLCLVAGGKVVRFEAKGPNAPSHPTMNELRRPDGSEAGNGVYAYRYQLTSLGLDPKEGIRVFKWVSPFFEQIPRYRLINITATNDPFLDGVALAYENEREEMEVREQMEDTEAEQMMEAAGCTPSDPSEEKLKKMTAYAKKMSEDLAKKDEEHAMAKKRMDEAHAEEKKETEKAMAKLRAMEADQNVEQKPTKDSKDSETMEEDENDQEAKQEHAMARRIYKSLGLPADPELARETVLQLRALPEEVSALQKRLKVTEEERMDEKRLAMEKEAATFAGAALHQKRWRPDHKGAEAMTKKWLMQAYMRNPREAEEMLQPPGTFGLAPAMVMGRLTEGGAPFGQEARKSWEPGKTQGLGSSLNKEVLRIQAEQEKQTGKPCSYERALALAERQHPHLAHAYSRDVLQKEEFPW